MPSFHRNPKPWTSRQDPEDGETAKRISAFVTPQGKRAVIGFSCDAGVKRNKGRAGARNAPKTIRNSLAGLAAPENCPAFADLGDIVVENDSLEDGQKLLAEYLTSNLKNHDRIVVFGGGHETAYGSYTGLKAAFPTKSIGIINLDAHLDLRNIGDAGPSSGTPFNQIRSLDPKNFKYLCIGVAQESNSQALFNRAKDWGVEVVFDTDLLSDTQAANHAIDLISGNCDIIYLTIDIDVLPHYVAPGVSAPAARGVPLLIVEHIINYVLTACERNGTALPLADIVEVSPPHDSNDMTSKIASILALALLSHV